MSTSTDADAAWPGRSGGGRRPPAAPASPCVPPSCRRSGTRHAAWRSSGASGTGAAIAPGATTRIRPAARPCGPSSSARASLAAISSRAPPVQRPVQGLHDRRGRPVVDAARRLVQDGREGRAGGRPAPTVRRGRRRCCRPPRRRASRARPAGRAPPAEAETKSIACVMGGGAGRPCAGGRGSRRSAAPATPASGGRRRACGWSTSPRRRSAPGALRRRRTLSARAGPGPGRLDGVDAELITFGRAPAGDHARTAGCVVRVLRPLGTSPAIPRTRSHLRSSVRSRRRHRPHPSLPQRTEPLAAAAAAIARSALRRRPTTGWAAAAGAVCCLDSSIAF